MHVLRWLKQAGIVILVAFAFGLSIAVLKGGEAGVRDSIGNMSAPWLLLPYFAGTTTGRPIRGAMIGGATCLAALAGFYTAEAFVLDLGGHPVLTNLVLTLGAGRYYFAAGILAGPLFGALGGICTRHRRAVTAAIIGLTLVGEPIAVFAWLGSQGIASSDTGFVVQYPVL